MRRPGASNGVDLPAPFGPDQADVLAAMHHRAGLEKEELFAVLLRMSSRRITMPVLAGPAALASGRRAARSPLRSRRAAAAIRARAAAPSRTSAHRPAPPRPAPCATRRPRSAPRYLRGRAVP